MKRYITLIAVLCAVSFSASAQVSKQVEVTKEYAPEIVKARKMDVAPNMVDTITLRPEIDYTITPRSFASTLGTHRFNAATATYWEYQRRYPFYLKLGAGYPLTTVGDLYATAHRADVGYITGYANHYGLYSKLRYVEGDASYNDNRSMQMNNKFGVIGGKYFGRYTLAGDLSYTMDVYHRYPLHNRYSESGEPEMVFKNRRIDYQDVKLGVSFGDTFADYRHLNFKIYAAADCFFDESSRFIEADRYHQMNVVAGLALAREVTKKSAISLNVDYEGYYGLKSLKNYKNSIVGATLMYRYRSGGLVDLNVGAKLCYDNNPADEVKSNRWHAFPVVNVSLNIGDSGVAVPYVEADGSLQNNSYASLARRNPYVAILGAPNTLLRSDKAVANTDLYNVRFGVSGHTADSKFAYRVYANMSFMLNAVYWYNVNQLFFDAISARRNVWSLCGAIDYRPISQLLITAQVKGSLYDNFAMLGDVQLGGAMPDYEAMLRVRYNHKKFTLGLSAEICGKTQWTTVFDERLFVEGSTAEAKIGRFTAPTALDLSLYADYKVNKTWTVFLQGNNLVGDVMPTYNWAFYREVGAGFLVGLKVQF